MAANYLSNVADFFWGIDLMSLLVFLLIFAIVFAVLQKTKIMGEERKNINTLISIIIAIIAVLPHFYYTSSRFDIVNVIGDALPSVSLVVVAIIMMLILIGLFAHDRLMFGVTMPGWIAFFSFLLIVIIFGSAAEWWWPGFNEFITNLFGEGALSVVIMILIFGIIIAFITSDSEKDKKMGAWEKMGINMKNLFNSK